MGFQLVISSLGVDVWWLGTSHLKAPTSRTNHIYVRASVAHHHSQAAKTSPINLAKLDQMVLRTGKSAAVLVLITLTSLTCDREISEA